MNNDGHCFGKGVSSYVFLKDAFQVRDQVGFQVLVTHNYLCDEVCHDIIISYVFVRLFARTSSFVYDKQHCALERLSYKPLSGGCRKGKGHD